MTRAYRFPRSFRWATALLGVLLVCGVAAARNIPGRARVAPWTAADARLATARLAHGLLKSRGFVRLRQRLKRRVRVVVAPTRNRSTQHVRTAPIARALRKALGASSSVALTKARGRRRADVLVSSTLLALDDATGGLTLHDTFLVARAVHVARFEILWVGVFRVRKLVKRRRTAWGGSASASKAKRPLPKATVKRLTAADGPVDLSGRFSGSDAVQLARAATRDLERRAAAVRRAGVRLVRPHPLRNRTSEAVPMALLRALFEAELLRGRSGLRLVAPRRVRRTLRALGVAVRPKALGADAVLSGELRILASLGARLYQLRLEIVHVRTQRKHWIGVKAVRKVVKAASAPGSRP